MGCDIHLFIEYADKEDKRDDRTWSSFSYGQISLGRNYLMFGYLTDGMVRYDVDLKYGIKPRGVPNKGNLSFEVNEEWAKDEKESHNFSWLTFEEYEMVLKAAKKELKKEGETLPIEYQAVLNTMKYFKKKGYLTRVVFWFDN